MILDSSKAMPSWHRMSPASQGGLPFTLVSRLDLFVHGKLVHSLLFHGPFTVPT